jgi:hypothetical protein
LRPLFLIAALPLALAACDQQPTATDEPETQIPVEPDEGIGNGAPPPPATASPVPTPSSSDGSAVPEVGIPASLQGRWGRAPADCTNARGAAEGLLRVSATTLTFYESVARLGTIRERSASSITADFAFSGEGMTWTREETLHARGDTLTRIERAEGQPQATYTYSKCAT